MSFGGEEEWRQREKENPRKKNQKKTTSKSYLPHQHPTVALSLLDSAGYPVKPSSCEAPMWWTGNSGAPALIACLTNPFLFAKYTRSVFAKSG